MKTIKTIAKLLIALTAIAGAVYVVATYGDKIVAWAKKLMESCPCKCKPAAEADTAPAEEEAPAKEAPVEEAPVEEAPVEEAPVEEAPAEEIPAEEAPVEYPLGEDAVVAAEEDFEN